LSLKRRINVIIGILKRQMFTVHAMAACRTRLRMPETLLHAACTVAAVVDTAVVLLTDFSRFRLSENSVRRLTVWRAKIIASDADGSAV
jgi:hypothetical protein